MLFVRHALMKKSVPSSAKQQREITIFTFQGHPTMILGEICVRGSQTVLRISVLRSQTAKDLFTETSRKRLATREK